MIIKILLILGLFVSSGILYRLGGKGKPFNTKYRDIGVPLIALILLFLLGGNVPLWIWLLCFGLMFGALTTYWDKVTKLWRKDESEYWENWFLHGFFTGLSMLPYAIYSGRWLGFILRTIILSISIMIWSEIISNDKWEEWGRGFLITITMPLLLL